MRHSILAAALLLTGASLAVAQDKPQPPPRDFKPETRQASDVLPALSLPEYVITGSDMISFTEDRKGTIDQPDSGEFTARAGRGEREQRFFDTSPTRMPLRKRPLEGSREVLRFRAGVGTFATPHFQAWYADRFRLGDAAAHMLYERSDGHVSQADYTHFAFDFAGGTYLPRTLTPLLSSSRLQGAFRADVREYGLYADKLERLDPSVEFRRDAVGLEYRVDLLSRRNRVLDYSLGMFLGTTSVDEALSVRDTLRLDEYRQAETRFGVDARAQFMADRFPVSTTLAMHVNDLSESDGDAVRPFFIRGGAASSYPLGEGTTLEGAADLSYYRGSDHAAHLRLYPTLRLRHTLDDDWSLQAAYAPAVLERTFGELYRLNPYMMLASAVRHSDTPLRFEAGASYDNRERTAGRITLSYSASSSWARFALLPDPVRQQWDVLYSGRTSILALQGDFAHAFSSRTRMLGTAVFRSSSNDEIDGSVPYLPDYEVRLLLRHDFPFDLSLQTTMQLAGEQQSTVRNIPAWLLLGLEVEYRVFRNVALFLRFDNLLDETYQQWDGYRERPFFMMGGANIRF